MDSLLFVKAAVAFVLVLSLMGGLHLFLRRFNGGLPAASKRLKVVEFLPLDARRRLVIVKRDDKEHLLLLGPQGETVVEAGINVKA